MVAEKIDQRLKENAIIEPPPFEKIENKFAASTFDRSGPVNSDVMCNLPLYDPPKWGWCALGGVADLLTPQERARRRQTRETFLRRQRFIQRQMVATVAKNSSQALESESAISEIGAVKKRDLANEKKNVETASIKAVSSKGRDIQVKDSDDVAPLKTKAETEVSTATEEKESIAPKERALPQSAQMAVETKTPPGKKYEGLVDKRKDTPTPHKQRIWKAHDDHSDFEFNAQEFSVDAYGPNLVAGQEPRNPMTGYLMPSKLFSTALDTNHTWDPNTIAKVLVRFPLTDDDDDDDDDKATDATPRQTRDREYFEEVLDWDLGDPETLSPASFALKTASDFGLAKHDMWDLQTSIELQLDQFVRSKLNYKPPIPVHEPFGLQRSDDENYNVSQVQRSTDRASSKRRSGGGSRRSNGAISRGGGARQGLPRKPPPRSVVHFDHSEFFINEVKKKLEIESKAQCLACEETNGGNFKYEHNAICHICHIRKPSIVRFGCGVKAHALCDNHCQSRLNFSASDAKRGLSTEALKYDKGGGCPICTMVCYCPKCLRRLDGICHEVGAVCMENKVLHPDWAMAVPENKEGVDNSGPSHEMDRFVVKTLEHKEILGYSMGKLNVPKVVPASRLARTNEYDDGLEQGNTAIGDGATENSKGTGTRKRSRHSAFGDGDLPVSSVRSSRSGRPRVSDLPYEMMGGQITNMPSGMSQDDIEIIGKGGVGRGRGASSASKISEIDDEEEREDTHTDYCVICSKGPGRGAKLLCCDICPRALHPKCIRNKRLGNHGLVALQNLRAAQKEGTTWKCPLCCRDDQVLESDKVEGLQCMAALEPVMSTLAYEPHFYHGFRLLCKVNEIVLRLMQFDFGNWFSAPVDVAVVPDYLDKITHPPMDLGTVAKRLANGDYVAAVLTNTAHWTEAEENDKADCDALGLAKGEDTCKQKQVDLDKHANRRRSKRKSPFESDIGTFRHTDKLHHEGKGPRINEVLLYVLKDVELIWHNCFTYNNAGSAVYRMGEVQRKKFITLLAGSVTKDLAPSIVSRLERYVKGLEQFRVSHEEEELWAEEKEKTRSTKGAVSNEGPAPLSVDSTYVAGDKEKDSQGINGKIDDKDSSTKEGDNEEAGETQGGEEGKLEKTSAVQEEKQGNKEDDLREVVKAAEQTEEEDEHSKQEQAKRLRIKEKASEKKLKVHVVCMPRSWGGKQKTVFIVDPVTLEKVQRYSSMQSAFAAFKYLEKLGHEQDIDRDKRSAKKNPLPNSKVTTVSQFRQAIQQKGCTDTLFGYFWCFEEDHKQMVGKRNSEERQQRLIQRAMSNDAVVASALPTLSEPAPGTPAKSPSVQKQGATVPSENHSEVFDISAMDKSGFQLGQDLDIGGAEFNFLDDNLLLQNTPNSPARSSATLKANSPMARVDSGQSQLTKPNLELPLPTQSKDKRSAPLPLPVGLTALEGIGLDSDDANPSSIRAHASPQIQESKLGDGYKPLVDPTQNVTKIPKSFANRSFSSATGASSRSELPVKETNQLQTQTASGSFVTFVEDKEKKQM